MALTSPRRVWITIRNVIHAINNSPETEKISADRIEDLTLPTGSLLGGIEPNVTAASGFELRFDTPYSALYDTQGGDYIVAAYGMVGRMKVNVSFERTPELVRFYPDMNVDYLYYTIAPVNQLT